jgi:hypothetical protein
MLMRHSQSEVNYVFITCRTATGYGNTGFVVFTRSYMTRLLDRLQENVFKSWVSPGFISSKIRLLLFHHLETFLYRPLETLVLALAHEK